MTQVTHSHSLVTDDATYQQRVALFAAVASSVGAFGMILRISVLVVTGNMRAIAEPHFVVNMAIMGATLGFWLFMRSGQRTRRQSEIAELVAIAVISTLLGVLSAYLRDPISRVLGPAVKELPQFTTLAILYVLSQFMVLRAAIVPSTAWRTFVITIDTGAPVVLIAGLQHLLPGIERSSAPMLGVLDAAAWWLFTIITCTVLSRHIFGLRQEIREARQLGQYTLEEKIGEGGMGRVYRARHAMLRRPTAIKLLLPDRIGESEIARFEREVQLSAELTHPNTITIYDYGRTPDNVFYYAMELLDGASLDGILRLSGPLPAARVIHILRQCAAALAEAHGKGLIHRDIKPPNIYLCRYAGEVDHAKVLDFGLVKEVGNNDDGLTHDGAITGTPMYMSPEMLAQPEKVGPASDIYALGAVGYFLLTGTPVFEGRSLVEICSHHLHSEPTPPSERLGQPVPEDLAAVLLDCLAKEPEARPDSAKVLVARLDRCADAGQWRDMDARAWWSEHRRALQAQQEPGSRSRTGHTIAVKLDERD